MKKYTVAVLAGDGIGPEVTDACERVLSRIQDTSGAFELDLQRHDAGAHTFLDAGVALPDETLAATRSADATLLAAMGLPSVRYPDGREVAPQIELRERLDLFAGVRPIRSIPGVPGPLSDPRAHGLDSVLIRESTEGLFAGRERTEFASDGTWAKNEVVMTRSGCERVVRAAFQLAATRRRHIDRQPRVTLVDKANVLGTFAFFREIFESIAGEFPDVHSDCRYVDAMALELVRRPWEFDVIVTENLFGDILSDLGAGLIGGLGMAPSADIGTHHAVFQPCHGTAPDIAGHGLANPTAMILSAAMMLEWLGQRHDDAALTQSAVLIEQAVDEAFRPGDLRSVEVGGNANCQLITEAILRSIDTVGHRCER
ncbi:3-isopropylmalate dehydrogenase [Ilumatobacter fluminis]|uniref:3-isopropylmalate dehydrogenase n=1 Tax=Ilumatobacter fluminis TaxID=467091 RepID=A0A4R7HV91_9ACTN|nr:isocitrate/isopropylmalate family dehydrogenase [Ilumatobacter fluminis]TDT14897.1 3-isopropylmalate dehydrogenase [Ilumatobacter fluminis]